MNWEEVIIYRSNLEKGRNLVPSVDLNAEKAFRTFDFAD